MKPKTINGQELLFVEVPKGAYNFEFVNRHTKCLNYRNKGRKHYVALNAPTLSKWSILGLAIQLSEEQWKGIVEGDDFIFKDYTGECNACATAYLSGLSLISSLTMNPETTLIIKNDT